MRQHGKERNKNRWKSDRYFGLKSNIILEKNIKFSTFSTRRSPYNVICSYSMFVLYELPETPLVLRAHFWSPRNVCFLLNFFLWLKPETTCNFSRFFIKHARKRAEKINFFRYKLTRRIFNGKISSTFMAVEKETRHRAVVALESKPCVIIPVIRLLYLRRPFVVDVYLLRQLINSDFIGRRFCIRSARQISATWYRQHQIIVEDSQNTLRKKHAPAMIKLALKYWKHFELKVWRTFFPSSPFLFLHLFHLVLQIHPQW